MEMWNKKYFHILYLKEFFIILSLDCPVFFEKCLVESDFSFKVCTLI